MKKLILSFAAILSGCASSITYTNDESCAIENMKLSGIERSSGNSFIYLGNGQYANASTAGTSVRCEVPSNDQEKQNIENLKSQLGPKVEYNESVGSKKLITAVGYFFYIVPGIAAKLYYDSEKDKAIQASQEIFQQRKPSSGP